MFLAARAHETSSLQAQAIRITELENKVKQTEQKRTEYEDVTIKLRALWDQLCEDLALLAQQAVTELVWSWHLLEHCSRAVPPGT